MPFEDKLQSVRSPMTIYTGNCALYYYTVYINIIPNMLY